MRRDLPPAVRLGGFAALLTAVLAGAYGVGAAAAPAVSPPAPSPEHPAHKATAASSGPVASAGLLPGLSVSQDGWTLRPVSDVLPAGSAVPFAFRITGPDGEPLTTYSRTHERDLHLVAVRRDLTAFQHVHPTLQDGVWTVPLDLSAPGSYRVLADFAPAGGAGVTLGADVSVGGTFSPVPLPAPAAAVVVDGYEVSLSGATPAVGETELVFTVRRDGRPARLEPYLGAFGHLVALRVGDLAYLHTHPGQDAAPGETGGPDVAFATVFPTAGSYRLHLDFQVDGRVHTAAFTVAVPEPPPAGPGDAAPPGSSEPADHAATPHEH